MPSAVVAIGPGKVTTRVVATTVMLGSGRAALNTIPESTGVAKYAFRLIKLTPKVV